MARQRIRARPDLDVGALLHRRHASDRRRVGARARRRDDRRHQPRHRRDAGHGPARRRRTTSPTRWPRPRTAFPAWRDTNPSVRGQLLLRWAELCREHGGELDLLERMEVGRPSWGTRAPDAEHHHLHRRAGRQGDRPDAAQRMFPDVVGMTLREPYGVCASIIPWNAPGPAHRAGRRRRRSPMGNTVVVKPAEDAPLTPLLHGQAGARGRHPRRASSTSSPATAREAGDALAHHPGVRRMSFTGSPETGQPGDGRPAPRT